MECQLGGGSTGEGAKKQQQHTSAGECRIRRDKGVPCTEATLAALSQTTVKYRR